MLELISLHVPKCAGTAFREVLESIYGDSYFGDYGYDRPIHPDAPFNMDPQGYLERMEAQAAPIIQGYRCVHGHFYIPKYARAADALRITLLRDPVERLISHYLYILWRNKDKHEPLPKYVLEYQLNIVQFSRLPVMRYFYTSQFFRDVDMGIFDAIGDYADMPAWCATLEKMLGYPMGIKNINDESAKAYSGLKHEIMTDDAIMAQLKDNLREDIDFYERHCH